MLHFKMSREAVARHSSKLTVDSLAQCCTTFAFTLAFGLLAFGLFAFGFCLRVRPLRENSRCRSLALKLLLNCLPYFGRVAFDLGDRKGSTLVPLQAAQAVEHELENKRNGLSGGDGLMRPLTVFEAVGSR